MYNSFLLYTNSSYKSFGVVDLLINHILILIINIFNTTKEKKLKKNVINKK